RYIVSFLEARGANSWQLDGIREHYDGAGKSKTADALLLALGFRVADLAFELALLFQLALPKEIVESLVQVSQCFLGRTLAHFVHPRDLGALYRIKLSMQVDSRGRLNTGIPCLLLLGKAPVVSPTSGAGAFKQQSSLLVVWLEFRFVTPLDFHFSFCSLRHESDAFSRQIVLDAPKNP